MTERQKNMRERLLLAGIDEINTQGVTGFVGHGSDPIPLTDEEVARMGIEKVYIDLDVEIGETVKVIR